ncbi:MAG: ROK family protein [Candidatus Neomarinimicrobiota bacterium]|nr:ROK family protein [Candidatus Neomarinimicrobiota bacterium]
MTYRIGLDLGGTKVLGVVTDSSFNVVYRKKHRLSNRTDILAVMDQISDVYKELVLNIKDSEIISVGIALPSPVDNQLGEAKQLTAFKENNFPVRAMLRERTEIEFKLGNDVNMATLAEYNFGAGKGASSLFTLYPGTGLGGGYIYNGKLITGYNSTAAEVGHMIVDIDGPLCKCGRHGCLEAIVSYHGFKTLLEEKINSGNSCVIDPGSFRAADIFDAWHNSDTIVSELLKYQARALGIGIANVINITGVERIIVGGTIYHELESDLMPIVKENADKYSIGNGLDGVKILLNDLGDEAPALGASMLD